jgi:hypothetical protein
LEAGVTGVADHWWTDDDQLLATLGEALRAGDVPGAVVRAGKLAYAAHGIDAQFAALTYDSAVDDGQALAATRAEPARARSLTFGSTTLTIELEVTEDAVLGQLLPPQPGTVQVEVDGGGDETVDVDEAGGFVVSPIPQSPFRLRFRTAAGGSVITGWIPL